jgi:hypothetical protein
VLLSVGGRAPRAARASASARVTSTLPAPAASRLATIASTSAGSLPRQHGLGRALTKLPMDVDAGEAEVVKGDCASRSSASAGIHPTALHRLEQLAELPPQPALGHPRVDTRHGRAGAYDGADRAALSA